MWVLYTLVCALALTTGDALIARVMRAGADEYLAGWLRILFTVPAMGLVLVLIEWPAIGPRFWMAVFMALPIEVLAIFLYMKALRVSPMSLAMPFLSFTPAFLIGTGYMILGELPSPSGAGGIALIVVGGYVLNIEHARRGWAEPLRAVVRERGPVLMLGVAFLYGFTAALVKLGVENSSPLFFSAVYYVLLAAAYAPLGLAGMARSRGPSAISPRGVLFLALAGAAIALMVMTNMIALSMTKAAYMISLKRTSMLMSVLYGCLILKEGRLRERLLGAGLMFLGFVAVVAAG